MYMFWLKNVKFVHIKIYVKIRVFLYGVSAVER